jgi:carboxyl-terminal processing protease
VSQVGYGVPVQVSVESRVVAGSIGYVAFNAFYAPLSERFADVMTGFLAKPITGLVLDLRGNEGGVVGMVRGLSGWLLERPASLGELVYRDARVDLAVSPRAPAQRYTGPIAVLVDELTASSAEIFAAGLQGLGRARVFGSPTAGDALPSVFERLPDGDSLQMAVADYRSPSGVRIEGRGVVPDTAAPLRRDLLLTGADPALAAALSWLEPSP